jgi:ribonuclease T1
MIASPRRLLRFLAVLLLGLASLASRPAGAGGPADGGRRHHRPAAAPATGSAVFADPAERREVEKTLDRIRAGGPFAHRQDGSVFANREGRLPARPRGYYREYTVETPGAHDRGARRIIRGDNGELWYTRDHYRAFLRIDPKALS